MEPILIYYIISFEATILLFSQENNPCGFVCGLFY